MFNHHPRMSHVELSNMLDYCLSEYGVVKFLSTRLCNMICDCPIWHSYCLCSWPNTSHRVSEWNGINLPQCAQNQFIIRSIVPQLDSPTDRSPVSICWLYRAPTFKSFIVTQYVMALFYVQLRTHFMSCTCKTQQMDTTT